MTSKKPKPNPMSPPKKTKGRATQLKGAKEQAPPSPRNSLPAPGSLSWDPARALTY